MDPVHAVETAWRASGKRRIAVSRSSWLRSAEWFPAAVKVPVVGGLTVWNAFTHPGDAFIVVEQPNFFGRIDTVPTVTADLSIRWWQPVGDLAGPVITADRSSGEVDTARRLATALRTIPGVKLPHGAPQAPWFVLSLRCGAQNVSRALAERGWLGATPLGDTFPEFPGGLHLEVAWPQQDNREIAATVRAAVEDAERP